MIKINQIKQAYVKTNRSQLVFGIVSIVIIGAICMMSRSRVSALVGFISLELMYLFFVVYCGCHIITERKKMNHIIRNGTCYSGTVKKLIQVRYESATKRHVDKRDAYETANGYYIVAEAATESGALIEFKSELMKEKAIKTISKEVKIYCYEGETCILWEKTDHCEPFKIQKDETIMHGDHFDMVLTLFNKIFAMILGAAAIFLVLLEIVFGQM